MDIVYILGTGSKWADNEIRYSIRSVVENVKDLGRIFIVGELPDFLKNVVHISSADLTLIRGWIAYTKIRLACRNPWLTENFLYMNDDFFVIKPIKAAEYPYYFKTTSAKMYNLNHGYNELILKKASENPDKPFLGVSNFEVHRPIRFNKKLYLEMPILNEGSLNFASRSFYCNYYGLPRICCKDPLFYPPNSLGELEFLASGLTDFSIVSSTALSPIFQKWIQQRFPDPSPFEK